LCLHRLVLSPACTDCRHHVMAASAGRHAAHFR
jgi:hypothetical protein